jgi:adenine-specific DNA-methyltransferase
MSSALRVSDQSRLPASRLAGLPTISLTPATPAEVVLPHTRTRRHQLGRFDTPRPLAQSLADWAITSSSDTVFEPSAGGGVFIHSAIYRLKSLHAPDARAHIWACDVDPSACRQTCDDTGIADDHLWNADLMSLVDGDGIAKRRFNVIIGNPPFVSVHTMSIDQRASARAAAERLGCALDRKASLWAYFLIASSRGLTPGGRLSLILPQAALHAGYARDAMHSVARCFKRSMMIDVRENCFAHAGTLERVIVFCGESLLPSPGDGPGPALVECASVADVRTFLDGASGPRFSRVPKLNGHAVPHLLSRTADSVVHLEQITASHSFEEFVDIKIGAVTGANNFFVLTESDRQRWKLPASSVIPVVQKFGTYAGLRFTRPHWKRLRAEGERCWLLMPQPEEKRSTVLAYLKTFDVQERDSNRTFSKRPHWYRTTLPKRPDAFMKYMGSSGPCVLRSTFVCQCTNSIHAIYFHPRVGSTKRQAVLLSLRSTFSKLSAEFEGRSYGSDALKLEPSEAKRVRILLPSRLNARRIRRLSSLVHDLLAAGHEDQAADLVDDWLYADIPTLRRQLPRAKATALLAQARTRRRGTLLAHQR